MPFDFRVPVSDEIKEKLNSIGNAVGDQMPKGWGFALLIFSFGPNGTLTYISNADRADMCAVMREFLNMHDKKAMQ